MEIIQILPAKFKAWENISESPTMPLRKSHAKRKADDNGVPIPKAKCAPN
jgi:hypothetical protein